MNQLTEDQQEVLQRQADAYANCVAVVQGTVLMKCYGGMWKLMSPAGEAEAPSLERLLILAEHRGLLEK